MEKLAGLAPTSRLTVAQRQAEVARLYPSGKYTMRELAELLGVGAMTVSRDVAALELPTRLRPNRSPKRRARVYVRRAKGQPRVELVCDTCGERFQRFKSQTINRRTGQPFPRHFCSMTCRNAAYPERGRLVSCAYCGREVYRIPAELDHDHVCCSRTCTAKLRGKLGLPQFIAPNWSAEAREHRLPKWSKAIAATRGKTVGRRRALSSEEDREIYEDWKGGITQGTLADRYGVSRDAVRGSLERSRRGEVSPKI
jgi:hypothetical protein